MYNMGYKIKECKVCKKEFKQFNSLDKCCSFTCKAKLNAKKSNKAVKQRVKIKPVSDKRLGELALYRERKKEYFKANPKCERCGEKATDIHHKNGRNGKRLVDSEYFMSACRKCHTWIHENPVEARRRCYLT
jgi:hypothetical protein